MSKTSNYELESTELYSLAGPAVPSRMMDEIPIYAAVSKPTKNLTNQRQQPPLDDEIPQQQQQPTPLDDYYDVDAIHVPQQQQPTPNEKPHQQPQQIVPHQEPVKKTQIVIIIVMLLLLLLALSVLSILVTAAVLASAGNTCTCGDTTANSTCSSSGGSGADEMNQILQIVRNISKNAGIYHYNSAQLQHNIQDTTVRVLTEELKAIELLNYTSTLIIDGLKANEEVFENSTQMLTDNIFSTSSHLENTTTELLANVVSELRENLDVQNKLLSSLKSISCKSIKSQQPNSPTGYYYNVNGRVIFCNMGELCGSGGGWTRLAYLNMTDDTENCPSEFRLYNQGGVRACGRLTNDSGGCSSVKFPSNGISYSEICGRVVGYQYGLTDAVHNRDNNNINGAYVDGVSITRGPPRQHVWTLTAGGSESGTSVSDCPCNTGSSQPIPSFINSSNYYCESGKGTSSNPVGKFYPSDPLWDGEGCDGNEISCCSSQDLPWFRRDYGNTTITDYIELRVCGDEGTNDEDVPVGLYEIYVK